MHEIPNFPFPSLHETEQTTPQPATESAVNEAPESLEADSED